MILFRRWASQMGICLGWWPGMAEKWRRWAAETERWRRSYSRANKVPLVTSTFRWENYSWYTTVLASSSTWDPALEKTLPETATELYPALSWPGSDSVRPWPRVEWRDLDWPFQNGSRNAWESSILGKISILGMSPFSNFIWMPHEPCKVLVIDDKHHTRSKLTHNTQGLSHRCSPHLSTESHKPPSPFPNSEYLPSKTNSFLW